MSIRVLEYAELAEHIVANAYRSGSADNCTCVVVFLCEPRKLWETFDTKSDSD